MTDWPLVSLADVLDQVDDRNSNGEVELVLSVTEKRGIIPQDEVFRKRIATDDTTKYKVVRPYDVAWNPYLLWTGAIGQWKGTAAGVTSPVYPIYRAKHEEDPRFWGLVLSSRALTGYFDSTAVGSIQRRRRTTIPVFESAEVRRPPLDEQRRIVDVMASVDSQIEALAAEVATSQQALSSFLKTASAEGGEYTAIVDLCSLVIGGIWGSPQGGAEVDVLALGPRIYTPGTSDFVTIGSPLRSFTAKQVSKRIVQPDDIILERSGGSPEQPVGRVVIAGHGLSPCIPTDFQRLLRPDPSKVNPRYLFWKMRTDWAVGVTRNFSRRTTGITNLSVKEYIAREIKVPAPDDQARIVETADSFDHQIRSGTAELAQLRTFQSALLSSLLNQDIEIPESYDSLLEEAS